MIEIQMAMPPSRQRSPCDEARERGVVEPRSLETFSLQASSHNHPTVLLRVDICPGPNAHLTSRRLSVSSDREKRAPHATAQEAEGPRAPHLSLPAYRRHRTGVHREHRLERGSLDARGVPEVGGAVGVDEPQPIVLGHVEVNDS